MSAQKLAAMSSYTRVENGYVIIVERGIFKQVDLYYRDRDLFAAHKDGLVMLMSNEGTSVGSLRWKEISGISRVNQFNGPKRVLPVPPKAAANSAGKKLRAVK